VYAGDTDKITVTIRGDILVIGTPRGDFSSGFWAGSAYVFRTSDGGATYGHVVKLTAADADSIDYFGSTVAVDGGTVVIGAEGDDSSTGAVYIFRTLDGGTTYDQVAKLTLADKTAGDYFGKSVAIDGDTVVVGASRLEGYVDWSNAIYARDAAYIFRTTDGGATYGQVAKLTNPAVNNEFGWSVAIDGGTVVVGARGDDAAGSEAGAAHVFCTTDGGGTYVEVAKLTASDAAPSDEIGYSEAIEGDATLHNASTVVVGSPYAGIGGAVYTFRTSDGGATWVETKLPADEPRRTPPSAIPWRSTAVSWWPGPSWTTAPVPQAPAPAARPTSSARATAGPRTGT